MDGTAHGGQRDCGIAAEYGGESTGERHHAVTTPVPRTAAVATADGVPALTDLAVGGKATEAAVGVGDGFGRLRGRVIWDRMA